MNGVQRVPKAKMKAMQLRKYGAQLPEGDAFLTLLNEHRKGSGVAAGSMVCNISAGEVDLQHLFRRVAARGGLKELGPGEKEW